MHEQLLIDTIILLVLFIIFFLLLTIKKMRDLLMLDYKLNDTGVPINVTQMVEAAESYYYSQNKGNQWIEAIQDVLAIVIPQIIYYFNFSVGRMRMKPRTMEANIIWAIKHKMLVFNSKASPKLIYLLGYLSMIPNVSHWQAEVYLAKLKSEHPQLKKINWSEIEQNNELIAKLYSGYMGAGGDWDAWKQNLEPGNEAKKRFKGMSYSK